MRNKTYKHETIETAVPYELEPTPQPILPLDGVKITRNNELDILHEIKRYARFGARKAGSVALMGLEATVNVLDEVMYPNRDNAVQ
jgi:hypothetical protein